MFASVFRRFNYYCFLISDIDLSGLTILIRYFRFCNYKTSRVKNLLIHLEAIHPGVSNSGVFDSTTTTAAPTPNQAPTISAPPQVRIVIRIFGDLAYPILFFLVRLPDARGERHRPLPILGKCRLRQQRLHARRPHRGQRRRPAEHLARRAAEHTSVGATISTCSECSNTVLTA